MSSSIDSGYYADQAVKAENEKCPKGGKHKWKTEGSWPSICYCCEKCEKRVYTK